MQSEDILKSVGLTIKMQEIHTSVAVYYSSHTHQQTFIASFRFYLYLVLTSRQSRLSTHCVGYDILFNIG